MKIKVIVFENNELATNCQWDLRSLRPEVCGKHTLVITTHLRRPSNPLKVERYNLAFPSLPINHRP